MADSEYRNYTTRNRAITEISVGWPDTATADPAIMVTPIGTILIKASNRLYVEMTIDRSIRLVDIETGAKAAIGRNDDITGVLHPNGQFCQFGSNCMKAVYYNVDGNLKRYSVLKGDRAVVYKENTDIIYCFDAHGSYTIPGYMVVAEYDFTLPIFLTDCLYGPNYVSTCMDLLRTGRSWTTPSGNRRWIVGKIIVTLYYDGSLGVRKLRSQISLKINPAFSRVALRTPLVTLITDDGYKKQTNIFYKYLHVFSNRQKFIIEIARIAAGLDVTNVDRDE